MTVVENLAALRALGKFAECIEIAEVQYQNYNDGTEVNILLEAMKACREGGMVEKSLFFANKIQLVQPGIPSVLNVLGL